MGVYKGVGAYHFEGSKVSGFGCRVLGCGFRVSDFRFWVSGEGFRV